MKNYSESENKKSYKKWSKKIKIILTNMKFDCKIKKKHYTYEFLIFNPYWL